MKKLFILAFVLLVNAMHSQSLDEIIKKHIDASGGKDNWSKIKSLRTTCTMKQGGSEILITISQMDKQAFRQDIEVAGMTGYQILTKTEGWSFMPFQGQTKPEPMTKDDVKSGQDDLAIQDEFITYKELGKKIELLGKEDIEGMECFKVKMTNKDGQENTFFMDTESYYVIKKVSKIKANGKEMESTTSFSNFEKLPEGIIYPMAISSEWGTADVIKVDVNPIFEPSLFQPEKK
jgi:hypothetical protein